jgi:hypothetical protein
VTDISVDELGPVEYLVAGFPAEAANFFRVLNLVMLMSDEGGPVAASELRDADDAEIGELRALERDLAILLAEEDVKEVGESLDPGSAAAVLVWENAWAAPFGSAGRRSGRELLGSGRIPTQALAAAVEDREAAEKVG